MGNFLLTVKWIGHCGSKLYWEFQWDQEKHKKIIEWKQVQAQLQSPNVTKTHKFSVILTIQIEASSLLQLC